MTRPQRNLAPISNEVETALYEVRKKIYPRAVHGRFAAWRWALVVYVVLQPTPFLAVGHWYRDFTQTTDAEVVQLLQPS